MWDPNTEFGARVERRLHQEIIIWLTTVGTDGTPQPSPVWFLWDGSTFLIYSRPDTPKLRNIGYQPRVALHFDGDGQGGDIIIFTGEAHVDLQTPPADQMPAYAAKYEDGIKGIGMTPDTFASAFSVPIRVTPTKLRGF